MKAASRARRAGRVVVVAAVLLAVSAPAVATSARPHPSSWLQPGYNAAHTNTNPYESVLRRSALPRVRHLATVTAPSGAALYPPPPPDLPFSCPDAVSPALLQSGRVYTVASGELTVSDAATGRVVRQRPIDPRAEVIADGLAIAGDRLFVDYSYCDGVTPDSGSSGAIAAYSLATGRLLWVRSVVPGSLLATDGYLISYHEFIDWAVLEVREQDTGALVWSQSDCAERVTAVASLLVYGCFGNLVAVDLATGRTVWHRPGGYWLPGLADAPGPEARHFYATDFDAGTDGALWDIDPRAGILRHRFNAAVFAEAVDGKRLYAACLPRIDDPYTQYSLCAYRIADGKRVWRVPATGAAAVAGGLIYSGDGRVLRASSGTLIRRLWAPALTGASDIAVGDGHIAVNRDTQVIDVYGLK